MCSICVRIIEFSSFCRDGIESEWMSFFPLLRNLFTIKNLRLNPRRLQSELHRIRFIWDYWFMSKTFVKWNWTCAHYSKNYLFRTKSYLIIFQTSFLNGIVFNIIIWKSMSTALVSCLQEYKKQSMSSASSYSSTVVEHNRKEKYSIETIEDVCRIINACFFERMRSSLEIMKEKISLSS